MGATTQHGAVVSEIRQIGLTQRPRPVMLAAVHARIAEYLADVDAHSRRFNIPKGVVDIQTGKLVASLTAAIPSAADPLERLAVQEALDLLGGAQINRGK